MMPGIGQRFQQLRQTVWDPFWQVAKPYWQSEERWRAIGLAVSLLLLSLVTSGLVVLFSILLGELANPLASRDLEQFVQAAAIFAVAVVIAVPLLSLKPFVQAKLGLYWRRWLTMHFLHNYFHDRTYYRLAAVPDIDNPDQRIAEDIKNFTQQAIAFGVIISDSCWQLLGFVGVLWATSKPLMLLLIGYAAIGNVLTAVVFGRVLVGINLELLRRETDFRFSLARVRDHAEAIAFYQGEAEEAATIQQNFTQVFRTIQRLIFWQLNLDGFQNTYQYVTFFLPAIVLAPPILAGTLPVGAFVQAGVAFKSVLNALGVLINQFEQFSAFAAGVSRLQTVQWFMEGGEKSNRDDGEAERARGKGKGAEITIVPANYLELRHLSLDLPGQQTRLIQDLSISFVDAASLLITGASGVGKTSLLRAIAGLWTTGSGTIIRPDLDQFLFLPQQPYLPSGSLRQQLLYPRSVDCDDAKLWDCLHQVNLQDTAQEWGGLDAIAEWSQTLSIGEQQRLSFARLLVQRPAYALLDEATSALDRAHETHLYRHLQATDTTYISVAHRASLKAFHAIVLELTGEMGGYKLHRLTDEPQRIL
jgi:ABC-type uncharacterized transport system fused permease/ATPase subunit